MAESVRRDRDDDFRYEIVRHFGILSTSVKGWTKEFNSVSWNGSTPKYDIRDWSAEHQHMSRGITMTREELEQFSRAYFRRARCSVKSEFHPPFSQIGITRNSRAP